MSPLEEVVERMQVLRGPGNRPPNGQTWWDEPGKCSTCGKDGNTRDHCHDTGFLRGNLCARCNLEEGREPGHPFWMLWRLTAPLLEKRLDYFGVGEWDNRNYLTSDERAELSIPEMIVTSKRRHSEHVVADFIERHGEPAWASDYVKKVLG